jgi:hypothetical protein
MKIHAELPLNRFEAGRLWVTDDAGKTIAGPGRCRGEADNTAARVHDNVQEDPRRAYGDHPCGVYQPTQVVRFSPGDPLYRTYGPAFIRLNPISGEALEAKRNGRTGIGLHGGALHPDGRLRETFGCNRADDTDIDTIATMLERHGFVGAIYECTLLTVAA